MDGRLAECGRLGSAMPGRGMAGQRGGAIDGPGCIAMHVPREAVLLRIFIGENDRIKGRPLFEAIVLRAREAGLAGATVLRGRMSFGKSSTLHTAKVLRLS